MKYVLVALCGWFSTNAFATNVSTVTCTDSQSNTSIVIQFDAKHPDSILVQNEKFLYVDDKTEGDINKVWYYHNDSTMYLKSSLMNNKVQSMYVKMSGHNTNFVVGECK